MIIAGKTFPSIGLIRAKPLGDTGRHMLTIYPPGSGPLEGHEPATMVELEVDQSEVQRIARVAPHLLGDARRALEYAGGRPWT